LLTYLIAGTFGMIGMIGKGIVTLCDPNPEPPFRENDEGSG